ncbi:MAG: acyl-CoA acyltransferase [Planctomycetes bacterium]|nr:acyl-CoA acyltransferase [Planctomycetota bacterium]
MPPWTAPPEIFQGNHVLASLIAILAAYLSAIAARPLLRVQGRVNPLAIGLAVALMGLALIVPPAEIQSRAAVMYLSTELTFKMIDYSRYCRSNDGGSFREYVRFLIPFPTMQVTFRRRELTVSIDYRREALRLIGGTGLVIFAVLTLQFFGRFPLVRSSFAVNHAVMLVLFVVAIESLSQALYGLERLAGQNPTPLINHAYLSQTVAEFWDRYNTRVHAWLTDNVFRPAGGIRSPVRGIFAAFFVSAVLHELAFGIATSRFDGYQFVFFMSQAPAVFVALRLKRVTRRWGIAGSILCHFTTIIWFAVSSMFFFHGVDRVFPFVYACQTWLP